MGEMEQDSESNQNRFNNVGSCDEVIILKEELGKAKRAAAEYQKMKSTFISNISHEMRTPLNAILGFSELSQVTDVSAEEIRDYMKIIHASSCELLEKIKDVIYISSLEAGEICPEEEGVSLYGLFKDIEEHYNNYELNSRRSSVVVKVNFDDTKYTYFAGDAGKMIMVLKKLIDNGIKFTKQGYVELSFENIHKGKICFVVKDTGIGIPLEKQKVIFEPFNTAEDSYNRNYSGSGLGLTIVQRLVKLMNGTIDIKSEVGRGTVMRLFFPFQSIRKKV